MIDIHSHIIPGIDDGIRDLDSLFKMIDIYISQGVEGVIATPHLYSGYFDNTKDIVKNEFNKIDGELKDRGIEFKIYPGSEVYITKNIIEDIKNDRVQTLNDSRYILVEFDFKKFKEDYIDIIYEIHLLGYRTIIAHPERYLYILKDATLLNQFIEEGCLFQLNTSSITGIFGKEVQKLSKRLFEEGIYSFVATDAHTLEGRGPFFNEAFKYMEKANRDFLSEIKNNTQFVLNNLEIDKKNVKIKSKRSIFDIFTKKG